MQRLMTDWHWEKCGHKESYTKQEALCPAVDQLPAMSVKFHCLKHGVFRLIPNGEKKVLKMLYVTQTLPQSAWLQWNQGKVGFLSPPIFRLSEMLLFSQGDLIALTMSFTELRGFIWQEVNTKRVYLCIFFFLLQPLLCLAPPNTHAEKTTKPTHRPFHRMVTVCYPQLSGWFSFL